MFWRTRNNSPIHASNSRTPLQVVVLTLQNQTDSKAYLATFTLNNVPVHGDFFLLFLFRRLLDIMAFSTVNSNSDPLIDNAFDDKPDLRQRIYSAIGTARKLLLFRF